MRYDLKKNTAKYVGATLRMCQLAGPEGTACFMPTRRSNVPCHVKMDTECVKQRTQKEFGQEKRQPTALSLGVEQSST